MSEKIETKKSKKEAQKPRSMIVDHIVNNTKYPDFIKKHPIFTKIGEVRKVFPSLGLPNCSEEVDFPSEDNLHDAIELLRTDITVALRRKYEELPSSKAGRTLVYNLYYSVYNYHSSGMVSSDLTTDKLNIKFVSGIADELNKAIFVENGTGFFKGYNKILEKLKTFDIVIPALDTYPKFKTISANNLGSKCKMHFSSIGKDGAWDIATMSQRGISSCQSWGNGEQCKGLVGSISSKYVGVAYLTSGKPFNEFGTKMMRRCVVRFCLHRTTKKPALLVDRIYPNNDVGSVGVFRAFLAKKTGLPVIFTGEVPFAEYSLPRENEEYAKTVIFGTKDFTYMYTKIPLMEQKLPVSKVSDALITSAITNLGTEVLKKASENIRTRYLAYIASNKTEHHDEFGTGLGNFIAAHEKLNETPELHRGWSVIPSNFMAVPSANQFNSESEIRRHILRHTLLNIRKWRTKQDEAMDGYIKHPGSFYRWFPTSAKKIVDHFHQEMKKYILNECIKTA